MLIVHKRPRPHIVCWFYTAKAPGLILFVDFTRQMPQALSCLLILHGKSHRPHSVCWFYTAKAPGLILFVDSTRQTHQDSFCLLIIHKCSKRYSVCTQTPQASFCFLIFVDHTQVPKALFWLLILHKRPRPHSVFVLFCCCFFLDGYGWAGNVPSTMLVKMNRKYASKADWCSRRAIVRKAGW